MKKSANWAPCFSLSIVSTILTALLLFCDATQVYTCIYLYSSALLTFRLEHPAADWESSQKQSRMSTLSPHKPAPALASPPTRPRLVDTPMPHSPQILRGLIHSPLNPLISLHLHC